MSQERLTPTATSYESMSLTGLPHLLGYRERPPMWVKPTRENTPFPHSPLEERVTTALAKNGIDLIAVLPGYLPSERTPHNQPPTPGAEVKFLFVAPEQIKSLAELNHILIGEILMDAAQKEHPLYDKTTDAYRQPVGDIIRCSFATPQFTQLPPGANGTQRESVINGGLAVLYGTNEETAWSRLFTPRLVVVVYPTRYFAQQAVSLLTHPGYSDTTSAHPPLLPFSEEHIPVHDFTLEELKVLLHPDEFKALMAERRNA